ncbi:Flp family type IVb pilin [Marinobacter sp.]|uniref:Flp family type IVb pilin n=1 Tax=Marinobacter sp. TaxID=50741 RepID=UPI003562652F
MKNFKEKVAAFIRDEEGLELSEYAVAGSLIVIAVVGVFTALGETIVTKIGEMITAMGGTPPA